VSIVYNAPQFAEREAYEETVGCGDGGTGSRWRTRKTDAFGPTYYVVYKTVCYVVFRAVGPLVVLFVLNTRLVLTLRRRGRRHQRRFHRPSTAAEDDGLAMNALGGTPVPQPPPTSTRRLSFQRENITMMLVVVVFVFIVCQLPDLGLRISASLVS